MSDNLSKNNTPKLKWWHKGALIGLGIAVLGPLLISLLVKSGVIETAEPAFYMGYLFLMELPVIPILWLMLIILSPLAESGLHILLAHLISWVIGGIVYAGIFKWLTKDSQKNKKQSGFALPIAILIVVVLIIIGGVGYYFYTTSQEQKEQVVDETADWEIYRNEKFGFEVRYPKDWKIVNVDWTAGKEYVQFLSPLINNKYYFVLNFGARNKGSNTQISYQPDEDWELLKSLMRLGDKVKIGNVDVLTTEIVEKGKVHSILYSNRLGVGRVEISGLEIQANSGFIEGPQHLSASDVESIDLKNLPELKLANQILSTFKFIK